MTNFPLKKKQINNKKQEKSVLLLVFTLVLSLTEEASTFLHVRGIQALS